MTWTALLSGAGGPVLAAAFGVLGVILGRYIAQGIKKEGEDKLTSRVNIALTILFSLFVVAYTIKEPTTDPLRLLGYGSAGGFIGLPILELLASQLSDRFRGALNGFMNPERTFMSDDEAGIRTAVYHLNEKEDTNGPSQ